MERMLPMHLVDLVARSATKLIPGQVMEKEKLIPFSAVTYWIGGGTHKRPSVVQMDHLWVVMEEGCFTWSRGGPASLPESEEDSSADEEAAANGVGSATVSLAAERASDTDTGRSGVCAVAMPPSEGKEETVMVARLSVH
ncbi:hypothetical protein O3P69_002668 [Scylla paramamosain]|uniref:Uncharacterized protein n=1 Tax=Scylla paramamosain TaxID=85552 RepID=A0AAW0UME9_SCYPA